VSNNNEFFAELRTVVLELPFVSGINPVKPVFGVMDMTLVDFRSDEGKDAGKKIFAEKRILTYNRPMLREYPSLARDIVAARQRGRRAAKRERELVGRGERPYGSYVKSPFVYESTFLPVSPEPFKEFAQRRRAEKGGFYTLDVMGATKYEPDYPLKRDSLIIDGQVSMTLVDFRSDEERRMDTLHNRVVIQGNVLGIVPWMKARRFISTNDDTELQGYDQIYCRPWLGGWDTVRESRFSTNPHHDLFEWYIVQMMFSMLSPHGGKLDVQMVIDSDYSSWVESLQRTDGIRANEEGSVISIVKEDAPRRLLLPRITGVKRPVFTQAA
jgi:hypothetical protein